MWHGQCFLRFRAESRSPFYFPTPVNNLNIHSQKSLAEVSTLSYHLVETYLCKHFPEGVECTQGVRLGTASHGLSNLQSIA